MYTGGSSEFNNKMLQGSGRKFTARFNLGGTWYSSQIKKLVINGGSNADKSNITIGSAVSQYIDVTMKNPEILLEGYEIQLQIGVTLADNSIEYVNAGYYTIQTPDVGEDGTVTFKAYDRMSKLETTYVSSLTYPTTAVAVVNEIATECGFTFVSTGLSSITISTKPEAYTRREIIAYMAAIYGKFAIFDRNGQLQFKWYTVVPDYTVAPSRTLSFTKSQNDFAVNRLVVSKDAQTSYSTGTGTVGISASNPWATQSIVNNIYTSIGGFTYRPSTVRYAGDIRLDPWDVITVQDLTDTSYLLPVMLLTQEYDGGLVSTVQAVGDANTAVTDKFTGPTTKALERAYTELLVVNSLVAEKVDADYITAHCVSTDDFTALTGRVVDLEANQITTTYLNANFADINLANITNGAIKTAMIDTGAVKTAQIADGSITDAKIVGLTANKITAGTIDASKITVTNLDCANLTVGTINGNQITDGAISSSKLNTTLSNTIADSKSSAEEALSQAGIAVEKASNIVPFINGTQTAITGSWTGVAPFSELTDGQQITYWLPYNGSGNVTLNLTLSDGTTTGVINCYYSGTSRLTTHYTAGNAIRLTYRKNVSIAGSATLYTGWWSDANYDTNDYYNQALGGVIKVSGAITSGHLICGTKDGYKNLSGSVVFDTTNPILYSTTTYAVGATTNAFYVFTKRINILGSTSCTGFSGTNGASVWLVGTLDGTTFTVKASGYLTCITPTTDDGYHYMKIGTCSYSANNTNSSYINLEIEHPIYKYINGAFKSVTQIATEAVSIATGKNTVYYQDSAPTGGTYKVNDMWFDTNDGNKMYYWNGTSWTAKQFGTSAIVAASITSDLLASSSVISGKIAAGAVTTDKLNALAVTAAKIAASAITTDKLAANAVTAAKIAAGTITATQLASETITATNLHSDCITSDKILADAVTTAKIAASAVTANEIATNAITTDKLSASAVTAIKIASGAITTEKLAANAVTAAKINVTDLFAQDITATGTITGGKFTGSGTAFIYPTNDDADVLSAYLWSGGTLTDAQKVAFDFNGDGKVDLFDFAMCKRLIWEVADISSFANYTPQDSIIAITIDTTNANKTVRLTGINSFGRNIDCFLGLNGLTCSNIEVSRVNSKLLLTNEINDSGILDVTGKATFSSDISVDGSITGGHVVLDTGGTTRLKLGNTGIAAEKSVSFIGGGYYPHNAGIYQSGSNGVAVGLYDWMNGLGVWQYYDTVFQMIFGVDLLPSKTGQHSLGSASMKWYTAYFTNAISTSDERKKNTITAFNETAAIDLIKAVKPITYYYDQDEAPTAYDKLRFGFGAQTTESVLNNLSSEFYNIKADQMAIIDKVPTEDGTDYNYGMCYTELISPIVKVEQYLLTETDEMKKEIVKLKDEVTDLKNEIALLKQGAA